MIFLIIDGQFLIYKSLFSHKNLTTEFKGKEIISGIPFAFLKAIIDMKIEFMPDFIFCTWEGHPLIKKKAYPKYKESRKPLEIDISTESNITRALLKSLKIPNLMSSGFEGEDVANYIKKKVVCEKNMGYMYSNDHDTFAMIRSNFVIINNKDGNYYIIDKQVLKEEYDLTPGQARQMKIIEGCSSDNITGFKGIGPVYAKYLIKKYGSAKKVIDNINETEKKYIKLNEIVRENAKFYSSLKYVTQIFCPTYVTIMKPRITGKYKNLLKEMECNTLLKGTNKKILELIRDDQKKLYHKIMKGVRSR